MAHPFLSAALLAAKPTILRAARDQFRLNPVGEHGAAHWGRVAFHARELARLEGVDPTVPLLFAWLHDCCRENEWEDPDHGPRAAAFVGQLHENGQMPLDRRSLNLLQKAIAEHSEGYTTGPAVVRVCWDADRLDLGRVGIRPNPRYLCTESGRDLARIHQAYRWSLGGQKPSMAPPNEDDFEDTPRPTSRKRFF